jgi:hypothetical protein
MAKTRKKLRRIQWDNLTEGDWVAMFWMVNAGETQVTHRATGIFQGFQRIAGKGGVEYFAVLRVIERRDITPPGAFRRKFELVDRGPLEFSTRGKPEFVKWDGKS